MGQSCAFKTFSFGKPWDAGFLECCHGASQTATNLELSTSSTPISFTNTTPKSSNRKNEPEDR